MSIAVNAGSIQDNLLQLIQALGEYLTSDDEFVRAKGNDYITIAYTSIIDSTFSHGTAVKYFDRVRTRSHQ